MRIRRQQRRRNVDSETFEPKSNDERDSSEIHLVECADGVGRPADNNG
ncbi:hypothetical protein XNA1_5110012 [Xenorhabdus nematophila str. Anatoliense]|nr:hypothetical protein XNA1_5110012 [Xenorhabdus nematophila str. Anatoliense]